jgi:hypothetical protein
MAHGSYDLMGVLASLNLGRHHGGSCACPGMALRVVVLVFLPGHCLYISSRVRLTGGPELYSG